MRDAFFAELQTLMKRDGRVVFLTGDLGYKLFDPLKVLYPERVVNCGIREAGMIGYAAGLAKTGFLPFIYSIAPFITLRCLEQIKIDLCYNRATAVLVGIGGGFAYGPNGPTHHGVDDICVLGALPEMRIWTPSDPREVRNCVRAVPGLAGPAYLRLGRNQEPVIPALHLTETALDEPLMVREGDDGVIVTAGFILSEVLKAVDQLNEQGVYPGVLRLATLQPFPDDFVTALINCGRPIMTVEECLSVGGMGHRIARMVAESSSGIRFRMLSIPSSFPESCLSREGLLDWAGLDATTIAGEYSRLFTGQTGPYR